VRTLAVFAVLVLAFVPSFPVLAQAPPVGQDWIVTEDTTVSDLVIYMGLYNLKVRPGATLQLNNVTLRFNQTSGYSGIFVDRGAVLKMDRCALNDVSKSVRPCFVVQGTVELTDTAVNRVGPYNYSGGIEIEGGQASFTRCRFANMSYYGLYCEDASVTVEGSSFVSNNNPGIYSYTSKIDVQNCTFRGYAGGLTAYQSEVNLSRSAFSLDRYGTYLADCSVTMVGCSFVGDDGPPGTLPQSDPGPPELGQADLSIIGCNFSQNSKGCYLNSYRDSSSYTGASLDGCTKSLVQNCSFSGYNNYGLVSGGASTVEIRASDFIDNSMAVYTYGYTPEELTVQRCRFIGSSPQSVALDTSSGGARFENNTLFSSGGMYYSPIRSDGASRIIGNTFISAVPSEYPAVMFESLGYSGTAEVSGNIIDGFSDAIYSSSNYGQLVVVDNTIKNCSNGVNLSGNSEVRGNTMDVDETGVRMVYYGRSDQPDRVTIAENSINSSSDGIWAIADSELRITGNRITTPSTGIRLGGAQGHINTVVISRNQVRAGRAGIDLDVVQVPSGKGSLDNNTVFGARYGIIMNGTNIPVSDNSLDNITECGINARDCAGNFSRAISSFSGERSANAAREVRSWTVTLSVEYNTNPPGDPQHLAPCRDYTVSVSDQRGAIGVDFDRYNQRMVLVDYEVMSNGSRFDYNPYQIMVTSPGRGAVRTNAMINERCGLSLILFKGPDIVASGLNISNRLPVEGELLLFCAMALNDGSFNPDKIAANSARLWLLLDGTVLTEMELPVFPNGTAQPLSAAWMATPGWHQVAFDVDASGAVPEVFEDNNRISIPFYVLPLPTGELSANVSEPGVGRPVEFSIGASCNVTAYRFDFGDGAQSDWLALPNISHVYLKPGDYVVKGFMVSPDGIIRECKSPLLVMVGNYPSGAALKAYPDPAHSGQPVLFTMAFSGWGINISHQIWYFGDGGYSFSNSISHVEHVFQRPGSYLVECVLGFEDGSSRTYRLNLSVGNALPVAAGRVSPSAGTSETVFSFVSESRDPDGNILRCLWDFGDGQTSFASFATHSFGRHGIFLVNLTVQDNLGQWSVPKAIPVTVENTPPSPRMRPLKGDPVPGSKLSFDGSATTDPDDPPGFLKYTWDFGDGSSAEGMKASHSYSKTGRYTVTLSVRDGAGGFSTKTAAVDIRDAVGPEIGWQFPAAVVGVLLAVSIVIYIIIRILTHRHEGHGPKPNGLKGRKPPIAR